jgi:galactose mutarotase-like enzyme
MQPVLPIDGPVVAGLGAPGLAGCSSMPHSNGAISHAPFGRTPDGTPIDFRKPVAIGGRINETNDDQIKFANGYDRNWVLNKLPGEFGPAATVYEPTSWRVMEIWTTAPGNPFDTGTRPSTYFPPAGTAYFDHSRKQALTLPENHPKCGL